MENVIGKPPSVKLALTGNPVVSANNNKLRNSISKYIKLNKLCLMHSNYVTKVCSFVRLQHLCRLYNI